MKKLGIFKPIAMLAVSFAVALKATVVDAAVTLPVALPVTDVETLAGLALVGLGVMWSIRKIIKTINRS